MSTPEEIKKIAEEYGKSVTDNVSYNAYSDPNKRREIAAKSGAYQARMVLEWLSKDYCIVPKSKVKEVMEYPQRHTELIQGTMHFQVIGIKKALIDIFGKSLFEEEKG